MLGIRIAGNRSTLRIGLGGVEFRLPLLINLFGLRGLEAVILNKATPRTTAVAADRGPEPETRTIARRSGSGAPCANVSRFTSVLCLAALGAKHGRDNNQYDRCPSRAARATETAAYAENVD